MRATFNGAMGIMSNAYHRFMQSRLTAEMPDIPDAVMQRYAPPESGNRHGSFHKAGARNTVERRSIVASRPSVTALRCC